jgi:hypothetical protein
LNETAERIEAVTLDQVNGLLVEKPFERSFLYSLAPAE